MQTGSPTFTDLPVDNSLYPNVRYLAGKNVISGFPDGSFCPADSITRAEAARMMVMAKGLKPANGGAQTFNDVPAGHWAYGVIEAAAQNGLFKGYPDGTFNPDGSITRAEAIALLMRLSGGALTEETVEIADVPAGHWAYRQVATAVQAGLVELSAGNSFNPDVNFQRGEMAKSLSALFTLSPVLRPNELTGKLTVKSGTVTVNGAKVESSVKVSAGDVIVTGANSKAEIAFDDGSGFLIDPGTEFTITTAKGFNYMKIDGAAGVAVDKLTVSLKKGNIFGALASRYDNNKTASLDGDNTVLLASLDMPPGILLAEGESADSEAAWWNEPYAERTRVEVDMPWGVAAIRGTFWSNLVTGSGQGSTAVLIGNATLTSGGQTVPLTGGQSSTVTSGGAPPTPPAPMSQTERQAFAGAQNWVSQRAQEIQNNLPPAPTPAVQGAQGPPNVVGPVTEALDQATSGVPPVPQTTDNGGGGGDSTPVVSPVTAYPESGSNIASGDYITLSTSTSGADIYYTTDGTTPGVDHGVHYTASFQVTVPVTVKAIAVKSGMQDSDIATFSYNMAQVATPYATPTPAGLVSSGTSVYLHCDTVSASVYYTTDGTQPEPYGLLYTGEGIPITGPVTVKAIAVKSGMAQSAEASFYYYVQGTASLSNPAHQNINKFDYLSSTITGAKLFAFKLDLDGEDVRTDEIIINANAVTGIQASDLSNLKVYIDQDNNDAVDADELVTADGAGSTINNGGSITVTAQGTSSLTGVQISGLRLTISQSAYDIILVGDIANIDVYDTVTFGITTAGFTGLTGVTSGLAITPTGGPVDGVQHYRNDH